jgi:hypothetical protein
LACFIAGFDILNLGSKSKKAQPTLSLFYCPKDPSGAGAQTQTTPKYLKTQLNDNFHFVFKWIRVNRACRQPVKKTAKLNRFKYLRIKEPTQPISNKRHFSEIFGCRGPQLPQHAFHS